jgi:hypothetical protein
MYWQSHMMHVLADVIGQRCMHAVNLQMGESALLVLLGRFYWGFDGQDSPMILKYAGDAGR